MRKVVIDNPRYPHHITITRNVSVESNNPFDRSDGGMLSVVIYDGDGRSFTDTTTDGAGKVDVNKRKSSIPVRFDAWPATVSVEVENNTPPSHPENVVGWPLDGDEIEVLRGNVVEKGKIKDFEPDNNRSIVYWELNRDIV